MSRRAGSTSPRLADAPRISACLIAKNERENVEPCLTSFADHVDEIVFVDTGSDDGTPREVRRVCRRHGWTDKLVLGRFEWCDDFAAAFNHADSIATGDWILTIHLDDRVIGARTLRRRLRVAPLTLTLIQLSYAYQRGVNGEAISHWSQRVARRHAPAWVGRAHEYRPVSADRCARLRSSDCRLVHKGDTVLHERRRRHIAELWLSEEPDSFDAQANHVSMSLGDGAYDEVLRVGRRYLRNAPPGERHLENVRLMVSLALTARGQARSARAFLKRWERADQTSPLPLIRLAMLEAALGNLAATIRAADAAQTRLDRRGFMSDQPTDAVLEGWLRDLRWSLTA